MEVGGLQANLFIIHSTQPFTLAALDVQYGLSAAKALNSSKQPATALAARPTPLPAWHGHHGSGCSTDCTRMATDNVQRRADACHHVLTLRVDQKLTVKLILPR